VKRTIRGRRISIDLDPDETLSAEKREKDLEKKKQKALKLLSTYPICSPFNQQVEVRNSPSGRGLHIIAWSTRGLFERELFLLRKIAGDDAMRIYLDEYGGGRMKEVLFTMKEKVKIDG